MPVSGRFRPPTKPFTLTRIYTEGAHTLPLSEAARPPFGGSGTSGLLSMVVRPLGVDTHSRSDGD